MFIIDDVDRVVAAIEKAREHAQQLGKPLQLDRVALNLGVSYDELWRLMNDDECKDEQKKQVRRLLKMAKQESRADLMDALSDKGNVTGYIFQGKVNHEMVEATQVNVKFSPVKFVGEDEIPD